MALVLAVAACGGARGAPPNDADDARRLGEAVARLRVERRAREQRIRELEGRLAERQTGAGELGGEPTLPVEVLTPPEPGEAAPQVDEPGGAGDERVVGVADDGSEIVYVDEAASGRVVAPSPELVAQMGRAPRRAVPPLDGPAIDDRGGRALLDGEGHDRIDPLPGDEPDGGARAGDAGQLSKLARRAARVPPVGRHVAVSPSPSKAAVAPGRIPPARGNDAGVAEEQYRAAVALVRGGKYPEAAAGLREFVRRYPNHDYADNAQYWLGEAFYAQRDYAQALAELRRVGELYPAGNKVPDALLKVGYCHLAMGDRETAVSVLRELVRLFPKSAPAALAARKLEETSR